MNICDLFIKEIVKISIYDNLIKLNIFIKSQFFREISNKELDKLCLYPNN